MKPAQLLYVEDNEQHRRLVKLILRLEGYPLLEAENGLECLTMVQRCPPALILMDIRLPLLDGIETAVRLRHMPRLAHIPIIAVTASAFPPDSEPNTAARFDGCLLKPFHAARLVALVRQFVQHPASSFVAV
ncbi:MAG: response regulator [Anaerolineae bacterium]|nr:response regulator [Anaerolineae bacterium]